MWPAIRVEADERALLFVAMSAGGVSPTPKRGSRMTRIATYAHRYATAGEMRNGPLRRMLSQEGLMPHQTSVVAVVECLSTDARGTSGCEPTRTWTPKL
jgi:hypothetical protein